MGTEIVTGHVQNKNGETGFKTLLLDALNSARWDAWQFGARLGLSSL